MASPAGEEIPIGPLVIRFLVEGQASRGSIAIFEFEVPAGARVPVAHSHDAYEETYGLAGVLTWTVDGHRAAIGPGEVLCIRHGAVHRFDNFHSAGAKTLTMVTPGTLGPNHFREIPEVMRGHGLTPVSESIHPGQVTKLPNRDCLGPATRLPGFCRLSTCIRGRIFRMRIYKNCVPFSPSDRSNVVFPAGEYADFREHDWRPVRAVSALTRADSAIRDHRDLALQREIQ